jgi:hypothetical protein
VSALEKWTNVGMVVYESQAPTVIPLHSTPLDSTRLRLLVHPWHTPPSGRYAALADTLIAEHRVVRPVAVLRKQLTAAEYSPLWPLTCL